MSEKLNPLREYFDTNDKGLMRKWTHYFEIYHRHFAQFRNKKPIVVELGVDQGGSLQMWKDYFGAGARVVGIDKNSKCKAVEEDGIEVFIGDQEDRIFLQKLVVELGHIDILIDDGGHRGRQQIASFEELYPVISTPGIYLVEDLQTNYSPTWEGGLYKSSTFIEYSKRLIDNINLTAIYKAERSKLVTGKVPITDYAQSAYSMTYYTSVFVIEKRKLGKFMPCKTGKALW